MQKAVRIHPKDNVAVALMPLKKDETFTFGDTTVTLKEDIEQGHKFSLCDIPANTNIIKYGTVIGHTVKDVAEGMHVHVENIKTNLGDLLEYTYEPESLEQPAPEGGHSTALSAKTAMSASAMRSGLSRPSAASTASFSGLSVNPSR